MSDAPHHRAAFINAIYEEGNKAEAIEYLQQTWNELCEARARIRELEAAQGVAVKPLEWQDARFSDCPREIADSLIGTYEALQWASGDYGGSFPADDPDQSETEFGDAASMQEAKAAAQADYERRIRSALTPAPVTVQEAARERVAQAIWDTLGSDYTFDEARKGEEKATHAQAVTWVFDVADAALRALAGQGGE